MRPFGTRDNTASQLKTSMYSLNDITNGYVKMEPPEDGLHYNGPSKQMVFTSKIPTVKEESPETLCSGIGHQAVLSQKAGYQGASLEEMGSQSDVLNIQITNVQGTPSVQNGSEHEVTSNQLENVVSELPASDGRNQDLQSNFEDVTQEKMPIEEEYHGEQQIITQENMYPVETEVQSTDQDKEMPERLSHHPYTESPQASSSGFQLSDQYPSPDGFQFDARMPAYQFGSSHQMSSNSTVPLYHIAVQDGLSTSQMGDNARYQAMSYQPEIRYHAGHSSHESLKARRFHQNQDVGPHRSSSTSSCNCCCHSPSQSESFFLPTFGAETQRPSVIMVPVNWSSTASGFSHVPLKVNSPYSLHSQTGRNVVDRLGSRYDSDSSDEDEDGNREKYFRMNTDGTTARFKLTKEDWERIPINTFPSGGRLLSGDWTRIFLSKVKESNPWCSLRFKNNHVRSENSRKIHSAVFFRGGAECKRPECNVKVRFVIQKERGKYVDVTYVGNVCHSSEPGGGDITSDKRRNKRVRRTYSS